MRVLARVLLLCALAALIPSAVYAQALIAGVVKDTSGAVLPGVTVEASSPVLIEKVRTVATDGEGNYRIVSLPPGTYSVTFTLTGFNTIKREGIVLQGNFAASVNAEMRVGALEETITVTGATPVVDIQSVRQETIQNAEVIRDLPTSRNATALAGLVPGMVTTVASNTAISRGNGSFAIHGGRTADSRTYYDGFSSTSISSGGSTSASEFAPNTAIAQEVGVVTSGGLGEAETGGVQINIVPREGSNSVHGSGFTSYANSGMQGSNLTDELRKSVPLPNTLQKAWEVSPTVGGPIAQDKLWYLFALRNSGTRTTVANMFYNLNANDPNKWTYVPDLTRPVLYDVTIKDASARLTWQASRRDKINFFYDMQDMKTGLLGVASPTGNTSPEAVTHVTTPINRMTQASWTSPFTSRLLFEAAGSDYFLRTVQPLSPDWNPAMIGVTEQGGARPGTTYREFPELNGYYATKQWRAAVSYVTGSHSIKVGYRGGRYHTDTRQNTHQAITYRLNNGVPNQLTLTDGSSRFNIIQPNNAFYAQDSWTLRRLTLQGGVRYDRATMTFPSQVIGFSRFIPNGFTTEETDGVRWNDINPRMSVGYDLTGDGKTAVRVTLGRFVGDLANGGSASVGTGLVAGGSGSFVNTRPVARLSITTTRAWNDANANYVPDCNLLNPVANGECGAFSVSTFGQNIYNTTFDPAILYGWGVRPYEWDFSASVQRELMPGLGINVGYFRRWFGNFTVVDNRAVGLQDYNSFSVPVASDPRLPNGGGGTIPGLYDVVPTKFGQTDNFVTASSNFGTWTERWNGVDVTLTGRAVNGITFSGGVSTGRRSENSCDVRANIHEFNPLNPYCATQEPFLTQVKAQGTYTVPRIDVLVSGTLQSNPGPALAANFVVPNATVAQSLGRSLAGNAANVTVNLVQPGTLYGDRTNQVDVRFAKVLKLGTTRTMVGVDVYNVLNRASVTAYQQAFGTQWLVPQGIMTARFAKLSFEINF